MKAKIILAILFSSTTTFVSAQFNLEQEIKYKWGLTTAINSIQAQVAIPLMTGPGAQIIDTDGNILAGGNRTDKSYSFSVIPKYHLNNNILVRFELGMTNLNLYANADQKGTINHVISNIEVTNKIYRYTPGFQWSFMKTKKTESYCGITASYISYKSIGRNYYYEYRDLGTDTIQYWGKIKETTPGGLSFGIGALTGFNFIVHKYISFGAELTSSALYYQLGGVTTSEETQQSFPDPPFSFVGTYINSYKGFKISKLISSFNITIWL